LPSPHISLNHSLYRMSRRFTKYRFTRDETFSETSRIYAIRITPLSISATIPWTAACWTLGRGSPECSRNHSLPQRASSIFSVWFHR
jgi:hypothetical protein